MFNNSISAQPWYNDSQNCYVDPANPYNPWPVTGPYVGDVPPWSPWQPQPSITITYPATATSTTVPDPEDSEPDEEDEVSPCLAELTQADFEALIRRVIKEEVDAVVRDVLSDRDEADRRERWCDEW